MVEIAIILWALVIVGLALALYGHFIEARRLQLTRRDLYLPHLPPQLEGLTIVHLTDFHARPLPHNAALSQAAVQMALDADPDLILVTGDLAHGSKHLDWTLELLRPLHARHGVFLVLGNHDFDWTLDHLLHHRPFVNQSWPSWREKTQQIEATLLENDCRVLEVNGCRVAVIGVGDASSGREDMALSLEGCEGADLRLLLDHTPDILDRPETDAVDLVLCGHTHGGQWRLPGIGTLWTPVWRDRRRSDGLLRCGETQCYVSRGIGSAVEMRINCPPEVALLTLRRGPAQGKLCRRYAVPQI